MIKKETYYLTQSAVIAALYVALTYAQEFLLPGTTSMAVQFRASELLTVLALFTPSAIPGLTIGCVIANLVCFQALPLDVIVGSLATFLACLCMYCLRNVRLFNVPVLSLLMLPIFAGVFLGLEIELFIGEGFTFVGFLTTAGLVALGEFVVVTICGGILAKHIEKTAIASKLMIRR